MLWRNSKKSNKLTPTIAATVSKSKSKQGWRDGCFLTRKTETYIMFVEIRCTIPTRFGRETRTYVKLEPLDEHMYKVVLRYNRLKIFSKQFAKPYWPFTRVAMSATQGLGSLKPNRMNTDQASYIQGIPNRHVRTRMLWVIVVQMNRLKIRIKTNLR